MKEKGQGIFMEIHCPGSSEVLSIIRNFVCSVASEMGFKDEEIAQIEMSVDEACSNVVCHAYDMVKEKLKQELAPPRYLIKLLIKATEDHLKITITDFGIGDKAGPHRGIQDLDEYPDRRRGLGTYIINQFMDEVEVDFPQGAGTKVSMVKFLPGSD